MKVFKVQAAVLAAVILFIATTSSIKSRFKGIKCTPLNKTILSVRYCYLKAYSRDYASMNFGTTRTVAAVKPYDVRSFIRKCYFDLSASF